jgi:hypothetical protein
MSDQKGGDASDRDHVLAALSELIEALDRRLPRVERLGETRIAREAAALREQAAIRIEQLRTRESNRQVREAELSEATMADDGGPLRRK